MLNKVLGTKIGMTQLFDKNGNVVPVTVVDVNHWFVTQIKTSEKDGYTSLQLGLLRKRFRGQEFSPLWLKAKKDFFLHIKEVCVEEAPALELGQSVNVTHATFKENDVVAVVGTSKGRGFQGVVKRWGFAGGPAAHGSKFHRRPGAGGCLRTQGEVIKGKRFPGHLGAEQVTVKGLRIIRIDPEKGCYFIKGAVPGKKDALVAIKK
ncbi:MAG: 50S ribosomal protein L3 [Candidatus Babeliales bacterium]|jgi:large subunit ribosomal protein L3